MNGLKIGSTTKTLQIFSNPKRDSGYLDVESMHENSIYQPPESSVSENFPYCFACFQLLRKPAMSCTCIIALDSKLTLPDPNYQCSQDSCDQCPSSLRTLKIKVRSLSRHATSIALSFGNPFATEIAKFRPCILSFQPRILRSSPSHAQRSGPQH